ncbi:MAG: GTP cyclohydrolase I FolE [Prevotella sp.]|nr:GTP cyclohydrolase I FolE [Prevotella sp.]MCM1075650.1 GTP cyclohydrolase I FolE [Ruminococcus sp.]
MSRKEKHNPEQVEAIAHHYREILRLIGEDPDREGLLKTPIRAAKALIDATCGYTANPDEMAQKAIFSHTGKGMVLVRNIEFYSLCEHHILPFFGRVTVGYIPDGKIIGLSKLARITDVFARRLQVQERLTEQICNYLTNAIPNKGVIVACTAGHLCMKMRGVEKQESETTTMEYSGAFENDPALRMEFMRLAEIQR